MHTIACIYVIDYDHNFKLQTVIEHRYNNFFDGIFAICIWHN